MLKTLDSLFPASMVTSTSAGEATSRRKRNSPTPSQVPRHRSCEGCRLRKLKCSRTENCLQCEKRGATCVWIGSAPSRTSEDATLEASEAEVVRLNKVIKQLEARIAKLEAGQQEQAPTPTASSSPDPAVTTSLERFEIASPRESMRPSTSSSRASSFEPLEPTPVAFAAPSYPQQSPYLAGPPPSAAARYAAAPTPASRPAPSVYSVDSFAPPSLSPSSSVTSFASSFQSLEHQQQQQDGRFIFGAGASQPQPSYYAPPPPQPHVYQHQGYPADRQQAVHWPVEERAVKAEEWGQAPNPIYGADSQGIGRVVYNHHGQQRWQQ